MVQENIVIVIIILVCLLIGAICVYGGIVGLRALKAWAKSEVAARDDDIQ